jgi:hypothetical protein
MMKKYLMIFALIPFSALADPAIETYEAISSGETVLISRIDNRTLEQAKSMRIQMAQSAADRLLTKGAGISSSGNTQEAQTAINQYNAVFGVSRPLSETDRLSSNRRPEAVAHIEAVAARLTSIEAAINAATTKEAVDAVDINFSDINY